MTLSETFRELHRRDRPLLLPNPWDAGSARVFASVGFEALATTSAGFAATLGRLDGGITREEALTHAADIVAATDLPVSADLENGFAHDPSGVAETIRLAVETGLAGCSIEDYTGDPDDPIYPFDHAVERVRAAVDAAAGRVVVTARSENLLHGRPDLADTVARLQAFQAAGADVLYAPGLVDADDIARIVEQIDRPLNVLALPGVPPVAELAELGVKRISVGSGFSLVAFGAVAGAARELLEQGTYRYWDLAQVGATARNEAF